MMRWEGKFIQILYVRAVWVLQDFSVCLTGYAYHITVAFAFFQPLRQLQQRVFAFFPYNHIKLRAFFQRVFIPKRDMGTADDG
jgi:hypothetical protein